MRPIDADELEKSLENYSNSHGLINAFVEFLNVMDEIHTLNVKPVIYGHWIDVAERDPWYKCSKCGESVWGSHRRYCPNCGAYMKGENNEEN